MNNIRSPAPAASMFNIGNMGNMGINRKNNIASNISNVATNVMANVANTASNVTNTVTNTTGSMMNKAKNMISNGPSGSQVIIISLISIVIIIFSVYWQQVQQGFTIMYQKLREMFGAAKSPIDTKSKNDVLPPETPENQIPGAEQTKMVEKILPGRREVFNISHNKYTYYDAEPLCKALGAELATYEQVKEAYGKGADWCNYGWVKGQMAVYPTQKETWEQIQNGPEDQRDACGRPGLNGGYFDNPELQFGVNCIGEKPPQKDHDATAIAAGEGAPLSPGALEFEKKVSKYRGEANYLPILPFNRKTWSN